MIYDVRRQQSKEVSHNKTTPSRRKTVSKFVPWGNPIKEETVAAFSRFITLFSWNNLTAHAVRRHETLLVSGIKVPCLFYLCDQLNHLQTTTPSSHCCIP